MTTGPSTACPCSPTPWRRGAARTLRSWDTSVARGRTRAVVGCWTPSWASPDRPAPSPGRRRGRCPAPARAGLLADVGQQGHEAGPLDGVLDGAPEGGAVAAALAAEQLALAVAQPLQGRHVLVVHERRPRTPFLGAELAALPPAPPELLANHCCWRLSWPVVGTAT